ncbi:MAG: hypothetical protein Q7K43_04640, partial [Candidatus Woesearchaeota archaeon]|nr:hypothetical protein [Candidatus Woesearchaeota archaeon]
ESEKTALVQFHKLELIKVLKKVEHIKERIHVLTGRKKTVRRTNAQLAAVAKPTRVRRTKAQMTAAAKQKKQTTVRSHHKKAATTRTTNIKWKTFVPDLLKQKGAPMTTREILNIAAKKFNVSIERKKMKSLSQILRNMKKAGHITAEEIKGSKIKQYSLVS